MTLTYIVCAFLGGIVSLTGCFLHSFFGALVQCFCLLCPLGVPLPFRTSIRCSFCLLDPCLRQRSVATTSTCSTSNSLSGVVSVNHSCLSACLLKTQTSVIKFQVKLIDSGIESIFTNHLLLNVVNSERNPKVLTCLQRQLVPRFWGFFLVYTRYIMLRQRYWYEHIICRFIRYCQRK